MVIIHRERVDIVQRYELVKIGYELVQIGYELEKVRVDLFPSEHLISHHVLGSCCSNLVFSVVFCISLFGHCFVCSTSIDGF